MYTIDVNSGRSTHQSSSSDVEEALVHINMEAAEEIATSAAPAQYRRSCHLRLYRYALT